MPQPNIQNERSQTTTIGITARPVVQALERDNEFERTLISHLCSVAIFSHLANWNANPGLNINTTQEASDLFLQYVHHTENSKQKDSNSARWINLSKVDELNKYSFARILYTAKQTISNSSNLEMSGPNIRNPRTKADYYSIQKEIDQDRITSYTSEVEPTNKKQVSNEIHDLITTLAADGHKTIDLSPLSVLDGTISDADYQAHMKRAVSLALRYNLRIISYPKDFKLTDSFIRKANIDRKQWRKIVGLDKPIEKIVPALKEVEEADQKAGELLEKINTLQQGIKTLHDRVVQDPELKALADDQPKNRAFNIASLNSKVHAINAKLLELDKNYHHLYDVAEILEKRIGKPFQTQNSDEIDKAFVKADRALEKVENDYNKLDVAYNRIIVQSQASVNQAGEQQDDDNDKDDANPTVVQHDDKDNNAVDPVEQNVAVIPNAAQNTNNMAENAKPNSADNPVIQNSEFDLIQAGLDFSDIFDNDEFGEATSEESTEESNSLNHDSEENEEESNTTSSRVQHQLSSTVDSDSEPDRIAPRTPVEGSERSSSDSEHSSQTDGEKNSVLSKYESSSSSETEESDTPESETERSSGETKDEQQSGAESAKEVQTENEPQKDTADTVKTGNTGNGSNDYEQQSGAESDVGSQSDRELETVKPINDAQSSSDESKDSLNRHPNNDDTDSANDEADNSGNVSNVVVDEHEQQSDIESASAQVTADTDEANNDSSVQASSDKSKDAVTSRPNDNKTDSEAEGAATDESSEAESQLNNDATNDSEHEVATRTTPEANTTHVTETTENLDENPATTTETTPAPNEAAAATQYQQWTNAKETAAASTQSADSADKSNADISDSSEGVIENSATDTNTIHNTTPIDEETNHNDTEGKILDEADSLLTDLLDMPQNSGKVPSNSETNMDGAQSAGRQQTTIQEGERLDVAKQPLDQQQTGQQNNEYQQQQVDQPEVAEQSTQSTSSSSESAKSDAQVLDLKEIIHTDGRDDPSQIEAHMENHIKDTSQDDWIDLMGQEASKHDTFDESAFLSSVPKRAENNGISAAATQIEDTKASAVKTTIATENSSTPPAEPTVTQNQQWANTKETSAAQPKNEFRIGTRKAPEGPQGEPQVSNTTNNTAEGPTFRKVELAQDDDTALAEAIIRDLGKEVEKTQTAVASTQSADSADKPNADISDLSEGVIENSATDTNTIHNTTPIDEETNHNDTEENILDEADSRLTDLQDMPQNSGKVPSNSETDMDGAQIAGRQQTTKQEGERLDVAKQPLDQQQTGQQNNEYQQQQVDQPEVTGQPKDYPEEVKLPVAEPLTGDDEQPEVFGQSEDQPEIVGQPDGAGQPKDQPEVTGQSTQSNSSSSESAKSDAQVLDLKEIIHTDGRDDPSQIEAHMENHIKDTSHDDWIDGMKQEASKRDKFDESADITKQSAAQSEHAPSASNKDSLIFSTDDTIEDVVESHEAVTSPALNTTPIGEESSKNSDRQTLDEAAALLTELQDMNQDSDTAPGNSETDAELIEKAERLTQLIRNDLANSQQSTVAAVVEEQSSDLSTPDSTGDAASTQQSDDEDAQATTAIEEAKSAEQISSTVQLSEEGDKQGAAEEVHAEQVAPAVDDIQQPIAAEAPVNKDVGQVLEDLAYYQQAKEQTPIVGEASSPISEQAAAAAEGSAYEAEQLSTFSSSETAEIDNAEAVVKQSDKKRMDLFNKGNVVVGKTEEELNADLKNYLEKTGAPTEVSDNSEVENENTTQYYGEIAAELDINLGEDNDSEEEKSGEDEDSEFDFIKQAGELTNQAQESQVNDINELVEDTIGLVRQDTTIDENEMRRELQNLAPVADASAKNNVVKATEKQTTATKTLPPSSNSMPAFFQQINDEKQTLGTTQNFTAHKGFSLFAKPRVEMSDEDLKAQKEKRNKLIKKDDEKSAGRETSNGTNSARHQKKGAATKTHTTNDRIQALGRMRRFNQKNTVQPTDAMTAKVKKTDPNGVSNNTTLNGRSPR